MPAMLALLALIRPGEASMASVVKLLGSPYTRFAEVLGQPTSVDENFAGQAYTRSEFALPGCIRAFVFSDPVQMRYPVEVFRVEFEFEPKKRSFPTVMKQIGLGNVGITGRASRPFKLAGKDAKGVRYRWFANWMPLDMQHERNDLLTLTVLPS